MIVLALLAPMAWAGPDEAPAVADRRATDDELLQAARTLARAGKFDAAAEQFRSLLDRQPSNRALRMDYARMLAYGRHLAQAMEQYQTILRSNPNDVAAQVGVAKVLAWQDRQDEALQVYENILKHRPNLYDALVGKAFTLLWLGRAGEARPLFEAAARRNPGDREVADALASYGKENTDAPDGANGAAAFNSPARTAGPAKRTSTPHLKSLTQSSPMTIPQDAPATPPTDTSFGIVQRRHSTRWAPMATALMVFVGTTLAYWRVRARSRSGIQRTAALLKPAQTTPEGQAIECMSNVTQPEAADTAPPATIEEPINVTALVGQTLQYDETRVAATEDPNAVSPPIIDEPITLTAANNDLEFDGAAVAEAAQANTALPPVEEPTSEPLRESASPCVLVLGTENSIVEFEQRVLAEVGTRSCAHYWARDAILTLEQQHFDAVVINGATCDGWTAEDVYGWLGVHRPGLEERLMLVAAEVDPRIQRFLSATGTRLLLHPFRGHEFVDFVIPALDLRMLIDPRSAEPFQAPSELARGDAPPTAAHPADWSTHPQL